MTTQTEAHRRAESMAKQTPQLKGEAKLRAELAKAWKDIETLSPIELMARNPQLAEFVKHWTDRAEKAEAKLEALAAPQGEPVAWRVWRGDAYELFFQRDSAVRRSWCFIKQPEVEPLYTHPAPAPLTDEQIEELYFGELDNRTLSFARAIERHVSGVK